jgi:hypothetical protein
LGPPTEKAEAVHVIRESTPLSALLLFFAEIITLQMGHTVQGRMEDYWMKMEQLCCPFYE